MCGFQSSFELHIFCRKTYGNTDLISSLYEVSVCPERGTCVLRTVLIIRT